MKKKKSSLFYIVILFIVILVIGLILWWKLSTGELYELDVPKAYNLSSISYELDSGSITVATEEEMNKVLNGISKLNLSTKKVSVQDIPVGVEMLVPIRLYYKEDDTLGTYYLYKKNDKYYLEEPYNGIYDITDEDYNYIIGLVRE